MDECKKHRHEEIDVAVRHILHLMEQGKAKQRMGIYTCTKCKKFHVTSHPGKDTEFIITIEKKPSVKI